MTTSNIKLDSLRNKLAEAKVELEEIAESGDLEEQLEAALRIEDLEAKFLRETGERPK